MAYTKGIDYNSHNATGGIDYFLLASFNEVKATLTDGVAKITQPNGTDISTTPFVQILVPTESSSFTSNMTTSNATGSYFYEHLGVITLSKIQVAATQLIKQMIGEKTMIIAVGYDGVGHVLGHTHGCEVAPSTMQSGTAGADANGYTVNVRAVEIENIAEVDPTNLALLIPE